MLRVKGLGLGQEIVGTSLSDTLITMAQVVEWLGDADYPVDGIVTHTFDLPEWKRALETASAGPNASAVKTTLRPNTEIPRVD